jgi:hypothetical protein
MSKASWQLKIQTLKEWIEWMKRNGKSKNRKVKRTTEE